LFPKREKWIGHFVDCRIFFTCNSMVGCY
jgi:hypothetical protein